MTGHDGATSQIIQHNLNGENCPGYVTEIYGGTVEALADAKNIESITCTMLEENFVVSGANKAEERAWPLYVNTTSRHTVEYDSNLRPRQSSRSRPGEIR